MILASYAAERLAAIHSTRHYLWYAAAAIIGALWLIGVAEWGAMRPRRWHRSRQPDVLERLRRGGW